MEKRRANVGEAVWVDCPGVVNDGQAAHYMRDYCSSCAPWWGRVPKCPNCNRKVTKITKSGRSRCRCGNWVRVSPEVKRAA